MKKSSQHLQLPRQISGTTRIRRQKPPSMCVVTLLANNVFKKKLILFWRVQNIK